MAVAKNKIVDRWRRSGRERCLWDRLVMTHVNADPDTADIVCGRADDTLFADVGDGHAQILKLKYVDGLPVRTIAEQMGVSETAAASRLARARRDCKRAVLRGDM